MNWIACFINTHVSLAAPLCWPVFPDWTILLQTVLANRLQVTGSRGRRTCGCNRYVIDSRDKAVCCFLYNNIYSQTMETTLSQVEHANAYPGLVLGKECAFLTLCKTRSILKQCLKKCSCFLSFVIAYFCIMLHPRVSLVILRRPSISKTSKTLTIILGTLEKQENVSFLQFDLAPNKWWTLYG